MDSDGANKELIITNAGDTINFYQQLKALRIRRFRCGGGVH